MEWIIYIVLGAGLFIVACIVGWIAGLFSSIYYLQDKHPEDLDSIMARIESKR